LFFTVDDIHIIQIAVVMRIVDLLDIPSLLSHNCVTIYWRTSLKITQLQWDDENLSYTSHHGVSPEEVEDVFNNYYFFRKDPEVKSNGEIRYIVAGIGLGKYLTIIVTKVNGTIYRPINAWPMSENYVKSFKRRLKAKGIK